MPCFTPELASTSVEFNSCLCVEVKEEAAPSISENNKTISDEQVYRPECALESELTANPQDRQQQS